MQRLVNCDFLNASGFKVNLSNKAKLLYFMFLINADDRGFVDNAKEIEETLDRCEENFDNVLFQLKYGDAIQELVDKRLVFDFVDKVGNHVYLIRHWFIHNKYRNGLSTNYYSYLARVELLHSKYQYVDSDTYCSKLNQSKLNQNKVKKIEIENNIINEKEKKESNDDENWEENWDNFVKELDSKGDKDND